MHEAISLDTTTATTRWQEDDHINEELSHDVSYMEILQATRSDYERQDVAKPKPAPIAIFSWADARSTAARLKEVSDFALALELRRRGYIGAQNVIAVTAARRARKILSSPHQKKSHKRGN
jgi:hypothetical protein